MAGKQDHLQAGKKKLEEFRKKKAAEKAKKSTSSSQLPPAGAGPEEKQTFESDPVRVRDSDGAATSNGVDRTFIEPSNVVMNNDYSATEFVRKSDLGSSDNKHASTLYSVKNHNANSADPLANHAKDEMLEPAGPNNVNTSSMEKRMIHNNAINYGNSAMPADGTAREQISSAYSFLVNDNDGTSGKYSNYKLGEGLSSDRENRFKDVRDTDTSLVSESYGSTLLQKKSSYSALRASDRRSSPYGDSDDHRTVVSEASLEDAQNADAALEHSERKFSSSLGHLTSATIPYMLSKESGSSGFGSDARSSSNQVPPSAALGGPNTRRSHPSFLDSINTSTVSSAPLPPSEPQNADSFNSKVHPMDALAFPASQDAVNSFSSSNGYNLFRHDVNEQNFESKHNFYSTKQNDDFAALEQHIEDLTQEKFSLQRALEASRTLAESLASENSALTDSYNQQGSVVHQLKSDMEKLQDEIKAHLVELESLKIEYTNAQLECNAADERAKLLASEVIGLEEKALRLRSSELKLERQLENSQAEISSFRKKVISLEKDRQDLQSTIDALQEEKKLLQSKLRKASASGKSVDVSKSPNLNKKDMSTSTEDLDATLATSNHEMQSTSLLNESDVSPLEIRQYGLEGLSLSVPPDQMRMIENINTLISELALEKEELVHALSAESSQNSKLKDMNKELSRKLEFQTQRLELLTAQSMASDNIPARQLDSRIIPESTQYADEGDEVVERVLGWIMKLFPGGPSRRRSSKLL